MTLLAIEQCDDVQDTLNEKKNVIIDVNVRYNKSHNE